MKLKVVLAILAVSVISIGVALLIHNKEADVPTEPQVATEQVNETVIPETVEEDLSNEGITVVDSNLDTTLAGTYYIITEAQSLFKEANQSSEVMDTLEVDSEITVSGLYGETGLFQVTDSEGIILGYVISDFTDTVKGGLNPDAVSEDTTTIDTGLTEEGTGVTQEELTQAIQDSLNEQASGSGDFGGWTYDSGNSDSGEVGGSLGEVPLGDGSGLTPGVVIN